MNRDDMDFGGLARDIERARQPLPKPCYVFDLDGTLADLTHRLRFIAGEPKNWEGFFNSCDRDKPIEPVCQLLRDLARESHIVILSGRSDACRAQTVAWLNRAGLSWDGLYMRAAGDHRPDYQVKKDLLACLRADGFAPILVIDDRKSVVDMWRAEGLTCLQAAEGDF